MHLARSRTRKKWVWLFTDLLACIGLLTLAIGLPVSAHTLETDGMIAGVLHTEPEDVPQSNTPTRYELFLSDSSSRFSVSACICTLSISGSDHFNRTRTTGMLSPSALNGSVIFPEPGEYELTFKGTPKTLGAFQPFTLLYHVHVAQGPKEVSPLAGLWLAAGIIIVIVTSGVCWIQLRTHHKRVQ